MLIDISMGILIYSVASYLFYEGFSWFWFVAAIFFAGLPDADMLIFAVLRKHYNLVSHHIIHFPILFVVPAMIFYFVGFDPYKVTLFLAGAISHFIHDSLAPTGIKWLWPFKRTRYRLTKRGFVNCDEASKKFFLEFKKGHEKRSFWQEIKVRFDLEKIGAGQISLFLMSIISLSLFFL